LGADIELCLANPGTTEMPIVLALDTVPGIRPVLGLHETICTGAADGYGRIAGKPALVLLHLGPGLANGLANLHNARRARSPVVVLVGEHASWHMAADAPLAMEIEKLAETFSAAVERVASPEGIGPALRRAIASALARNGGVATLVVPHDHQIAVAGPGSPVPDAVPATPTAEERTVRDAAALLRSGQSGALILGGRALHGTGLELAGRIARRTGCALLGEVGFARLETGWGLPSVRRLPYFANEAQEALRRLRGVIGVGAKKPVSFFGWPGQPNRYLDGRDDVVWLAGPDEDAVDALERLADRLGAFEPWRPEPPDPLDLPTGALDAAKIAGVLAALQPEGAIIVPTAVTSAYPYSTIATRARPHTQLALTGGAIGEGPALAIGAALADPGRKVVNLEADGSCAYAMQAFWTQARERLDIVTIVCANQAYRILQLEMERAGMPWQGPAASGLTSLSRPPIGWARIAEAQGVPARRVETAEDLADGLRAALATRGPLLLEAVF
jgi:acetolactate synthase-1/2/3 large subunit